MVFTPIGRLRFQASLSARRVPLLRTCIATGVTADRPHQREHTGWQVLPGTLARLHRACELVPRWNARASAPCRNTQAKAGRPAHSVVDNDVTALRFDD